MKYVLDPALVGYLKKEADGRLTAKLVSEGAKDAAIVLEKGLVIKVKKTDLEGVTLGNADSAELVFSADGQLTDFIKAEKRKVDTTGAPRSGCVRFGGAPQR